MARGLTLVLAAASLLAGLCAQQKEMKEEDWEHFDFDMEIKRKAGQAKLNIKKDHDAALKYIDDILNLGIKWKRVIKDSAAKRDIPDDQPHIPFGINITDPVDCVPERDGAVMGDILRVHYVGKLAADEKVVDTSFKTGSVPQKLILGSQSMRNFPACWEPGLQGICKGERRIVGCPAAMAFGREGNPPFVPPHADLYYSFSLEDLTQRGLRGMVKPQEL